MNLSILIPLFNEAESVLPLYEATTRVMKNLGEPYEIIFVDDGSIDATFEEACKITKQDASLKVVQLSGNFGQTAALNAGFKQARGSIIITMDGDLQNDPEDIPAFVKKIREGYDLVIGWRQQRKDDFILRTFPSRIANWLVRKVSGVAVRDNGCALRAYRATVIKKFPLYSEMHRLLPVIIGLTGARIAELPVNHFPRRFGSSKYGLSRIYKVLFDLAALKMIFTFFPRPLFGFGNYGIITILLSLITLLATIVQWVYLPKTPLVISIGVSILFFSLGISLIVQGLICQLIYRNGHLQVENLLTPHTFSANDTKKNYNQKQFDHYES